MPPNRPEALSQAAVLKTFRLTGRCVMRCCGTSLFWEASTQLPEDFKKAHPSVNWARPSQLRNRIVHGYWSMDVENLHTTASDDLAAFIAELQVVLATVEL